MDRQSKKITALYCRLAHDFNAADTYCAYTQVEQLTQYAKEHNLENPHFFCDWGYSGTSSDRPEYQRMLWEVINRNVSNVVVVNISRLERDYVDLWKLIQDTFPHYGVKFHSIQDGNAIAEMLETSTQTWAKIGEAYHQDRKGGQK